MAAIAKLGEARASLIILVTILVSGRPLIQTEISSAIYFGYKLGRHTMNTAIKSCEELGLITIEERKVGNNPMPSRFHSLTPKGKKIAELAHQMNLILLEE